MKNTGKHVRILLLSIWFQCLFANGFGQKGILEKYESFYRQNASSIDSMVNKFEEMYAQRPFSIGFTDRSFQHFSMEVYTDSVRYIYNTSLSNGMEWHQAVCCQYDSARLIDIALHLDRLKCLWIGKTSFYKNGVKEWITFLSFRQLKKGTIFSPEKYVVLLFPPKKEGAIVNSTRLQEGDIKQVGNNVFLTLGNGFR